MLTKAAAVYREAGSTWARIAQLVADCPDPAVRKGCEMADHRIESGDASTDGSSEEVDSFAARQRLATTCRLSKESASRLYQEIAALVGQIADAERAAVGLLNTTR